LKLIGKIFIILIFFCYFFLFGRPLDPEISFSPLWVENLELKSVNPVGDEDYLIDFNLDGKFGYLDRNGSIIFSENLLYGVAIDQNGFISYSRQNDVLVLKDKEGLFINTINLSGYLYFSANRRFIISYDSNGISEIDKDGNIVWKKTFSSSISSVSADGSIVFVGTVDGRIRLIDLKGEILFFEDTRTSRINIVYGGAVSFNNDLMLTVTGIEPQLLSLWNKPGGNYQVQSSWVLADELRRHAVTGFSDDGLYGYVEAEGELLVLNLKHNKLHSIPMTGRLQNIIFPGDSGLIYMMGNDSDGLYLKILEPEGNCLFYSRLPGKEAMLRKDLNRIYIGIDESLIGYDMESM
jgi:WD40 repeat protein